VRKGWAAAALACALSCAHADTATDAAIALYSSKHYTEAQAAFEKIATADPQNAAACYYLGIIYERRGGDRALNHAVAWLEKAVNLAPNNAGYLADYAGTCMLIADIERSFNYATRGRDAMEKAIVMDPNNLDARDGLMKFYAQAPWPLEDSSRALTQAEEIGRRNSARGLRAYLRIAQIFEKNGDRPAAREACKAALKLEPTNKTALAVLARLGNP
jgi:tetratricopeptide (TPR) repeat protein